MPTSTIGITGIKTLVGYLEPDGVIIAGGMSDSVSFFRIAPSEL